MSPGEPGPEARRPGSKQHIDGTTSMAKQQQQQCEPSHADAARIIIAIRHTPRRPSDEETKSAERTANALKRAASQTETQKHSRSTPRFITASGVGVKAPKEVGMLLAERDRRTKERRKEEQRNRKTRTKGSRSDRKTEGNGRCRHTPGCRIGAHD